MSGKYRQAGGFHSSATIDFDVIHQFRINTDISHHRFGALMPISGAEEVAA